MSFKEGINKRFAGPLEGYRVVELGNIIAAPFGARLLADFGAEVIKVERPRRGDELRSWRLFRGQNSMMWYTLGRNKKSVTLDLRTPEGQQIALDLVGKADVVLENFRPGTLERWNLGFEKMKEVNPHTILVRISGFGQTGPYRDRPGFGGVAEGMGGIRNLTGYPDRPPTRVGVSLGDSLAGMFGVIGALMCLLSRDRGRAKGKDSPGQVIDVALYEAVFALMESLVPEYDAYGVMRQRTANSLPGVAPSNTYPCKEDKWIVIGGNGDGIFPRLMRAIDRPDLAEDPTLATNAGRAEYQVMLDDVIAEWTSTRTLEDIMNIMVPAGIPSGPIYDASDILADPHFKARDMLIVQETEVEPGVTERVHYPGIVPKLSETPGRAGWVGPKLGEHNREIYAGLLGLADADLELLEEKGVI